MGRTLAVVRTVVSWSLPMPLRPSPHRQQSRVRRSSAAVAAPFTALVMFSPVPTVAPSGVIATLLPPDLIASPAVLLPTVTGNPPRATAATLCVSV